MRKSIIYTILFILSGGCSMPVDRHLYQYPNAQLISPCGGGNDNNGMLWTISGDFYAYPGENTMKLESKYAKWRPSINSKSMVKKGYGILIPDKKDLAPGAWERYETLMKVSKIKEVKTKDGMFITREYL